MRSGQSKPWKRHVESQCGVKIALVYMLIQRTLSQSADMKYLAIFVLRYARLACVVGPFGDVSSHGM